MAALAGRAWGAVPLPLWSCPVRALTGVPCPTCYLTRSVLATFRGDLAGALRWHAFGPPLVLAGVALLGHQLLRGRSPDPGRLGVALAAGTGLLFFYWLLRLARPELLP
jgi:hypothetical protein